MPTTTDHAPPVRTAGRRCGLPTGRWPALRREVLLVGSLFGGYEAGRLLGSSGASAAYHNATALLAVERWLHLPSEQHLQAVVLGLPLLVRAANAYYALAHLPVTVGVLVWLFLTRPGHYAWARRSIVAATGVGLLLCLTLPVAPPRMLGGLGFVDTGLRYGQSVYGSRATGTLSNQLAAMPSLHVGWALLVAVAAVGASRTRWRWLWAVHPVITFAVVVVTANHYWVDGLAGAGLVAAALLVTRPVPAVRVPRQSGPPAVEGGPA